jgi:hypothetical protein
MIHAIILHIVLIHAQMTVPWIGGPAPVAAPVATNYTPLILSPGSKYILMPGQTLVLFK